MQSPNSTPWDPTNNVLNVAKPEPVTRSGRPECPKQTVVRSHQTEAECGGQRCDVEVEGRDCHTLRDS
jgi:hypothetical protein